MTTIFMNDQNSLTAAIEMFLDFEKIAGLKINLEKCEIIELGPTNLDHATLSNKLANLRVNKECFKTLGIWFSKDQKESTALNYEERLQKINMLLQIWRQRSLSWKGRVMIISDSDFFTAHTLICYAFYPTEGARTAG